MRIDKRTRTKDILPLVADKELMEAVLDTVPEWPLEKPLLSMTCGEFIEAANPEYALAFMRERKALKALGMVKSYKNQMNAITKVLKKNSIKETEEMKRAKIGVVFPTFAEDILMTVTEYLGLDRIEKAADVPFSEFLMIHRRKSSESKVSDNYRKITEQKSKMANGKKLHH